MEMHCRGIVHDYEYKVHFQITNGKYNFSACVASVKIQKKFYRLVLCLPNTDQESKEMSKFI